MRTPITLEEFLFTLNQDEDTLVTIIDYEKDESIIKTWKNDVRRTAKTYFDIIKDWFVQDFIITMEGLEITIVKFETELD